jgi:hypothetical protein
MERKLLDQGVCDRVESLSFSSIIIESNSTDQDNSVFDSLSKFWHIVLAGSVVFFTTHSF